MSYTIDTGRVYHTRHLRNTMHWEVQHEELARARATSPLYKMVLTKPASDHLMSASTAEDEIRHHLSAREEVEYCTDSRTEKLTRLNKVYGYWCQCGFCRRSRVGKQGPGYRQRGTPGVANYPDGTERIAYSWRASPSCWKDQRPYQAHGRVAI